MYENRQSWLFTRAVVRRLAIISPTLILVICCLNSTTCSQDSQAGPRLIRTYGGDLYIRFPNYDIRLQGAGSRQFDVNPYRTLGAPVVFRNNQGMFWNGAAGFISPNYPCYLVTKNRYALLSVNTPETATRPKSKAFPTPDLAPTAGAIHIPDTPYRPPSEGDVVLKMSERKMPGMLRMSRLEANSPTTLQASSVLKRSGSNQTRSTSTILVQPLSPPRNHPPAHNSLGLFLRR
ncbi:MAG: hypothetical protein GY768_15715 [Planctomycetaceae bacterium]|nr:hypothetical protein [Planctomycetaceae bacterium]